MPGPYVWFSGEEARNPRLIKFRVLAELNEKRLRGMPSTEIAMMWLAVGTIWGQGMEYGDRWGWPYFDIYGSW